MEKYSPRPPAPGNPVWGPATGAHFETFVVTEIHKLLQTTGDSTRMTFDRTSSGREIDLVLEGSGLLAIEIKKRREVD